MRIKEVLKEKGMTAKELAAKLGISETGLSLAIKNSSFSLIRLREIADAIHCNIHELLTDESKYPSANFTAMFECRGNLYCAHTIEQARDILDTLEKEGASAR